MTMKEITNPYDAQQTYINRRDRDSPSVFIVKAKHIEGTQLCSIELPCKYKDKELTILVYTNE